MGGWARAGEVAGLVEVWTELRVEVVLARGPDFVVCEVGTGGRHVM